MAFSASDSAFEGFRIIRREPVTVLIWAALLLVLSFALTAVMAPMVRDMTSNLTPGAKSPAVQLALFGNLGRIYLVAIPIELIMLSVFSAAVYRAILRPEDNGLARLRFGADELRLIGLYLLLGLFLFVVFVVLALVAALLAGGVIAVTRSSGNAGIGLTVVIIYLALIAGWALLGVKLSFAGPMTFAQKRIRLFSSWNATKGKFWPLLGCYLLAFVFMIIIALADLVVSGAVMFGMGGGSLSGLMNLFNPAAASAMNVLSPVHLVRLVLGAGFGVVLWTVALAPSAKAYREIAAPRPEDQAATFA